MRRVSGSHAPNSKNRSSKHLSLLMGYKNVYRSMNNSMLKELSSIDDWSARKEMNRRSKKSQSKKDR